MQAPPVLPSMLRIAHALDAQLRAAMQRAFPDAAASAEAAGQLLDPQLAPASKPEFGDFQANGALPLAKPLGQPPRKIADAVVAELNNDPAFTALCLEPQIAGPGFINLTLRPERLTAAVAERLGDPRLGVPTAAEEAGRLAEGLGHGQGAIGLEVAELRLAGGRQLGIEGCSCLQSGGRRLRKRPLQGRAQLTVEGLGEAEHGAGRG